MSEYNKKKNISWQNTVLGIIVLGLFVSWLSQLLFNKTDVYNKIIGYKNSIINGDNNIVDNKTINLIDNKNKENNYKEYIFVNDLFYVQALTDSNNKVLLYSVTTRRKDFNPSLKILDDPIEVVLGKTKFADIRQEPEKKHGWVGARTFFYAEKYYFGNPGNYADYFFSINDAGYLKFNKNFGQFSFLNPEFINENENSQAIRDFRENSIINTYSVTQPLLSLNFEEKLNYRFGPFIDQVRVIKNNDENFGNKDKWLEVLGKLYADVDIQYFNELLGNPMFINNVELK